MTNHDAAEDEWRAPYLSYATLSNFLDNKIGSGAIPPRIDTGFIDNYAGSVRPLLLATLKTIGMIDEDRKVLDPLREAAHGEESRKKVLRSWAERFYAEQIALAPQNATAQMLWETFSRRKFNGSTLRRAVIFYLSLAEDLSLPVSAHFKAPKAPPPSGATARKAGKKSAPTRDQPEDGGDHDAHDGAAAQSSGVERRFVRLGDAGTVSVTVDVRWLDLPDDQFTKLRQLIKDLEALEVAGHGTGNTTEDSP